MSQNIYDLSQFCHYIPENNKPYYIIDPQSEEEHRRLFDYIGHQAHFEGFLRELRCELKQLKAQETSQEPLIRVARALRIGETAEGEIVLLIIQAFVHQNEIKGGSFVVACAPTGLDQLYADLEVEERQVPRRNW